MSAPARILCVGTHHKTGTVWMRRVWHAVAQAQGLPLIHVDTTTRAADLPAPGPVICVNWSSAFPAELWNCAQARFLHVIRDPRDVLLSGMRYHRGAPPDRERFVHLPRADLDGRTYHQHLQALPDDTARLLFEMSEKHDQTVREMLTWPYGHPRAVDLRYEDLIADADCAQFKEALARLDIAGLDRAQALQAYWRNALFGGLAAPGARPPGVARHVRSGRAEQWRKDLPRGVAQVYARRYAKALRVLGYAGNRRWVAQCPWMTPAPQAAASAPARTQPRAGARPDGR